MRRHSSTRPHVTVSAACVVPISFFTIPKYLFKTNNYSHHNHSLYPTHISPLHITTGPPHLLTGFIIKTRYQEWFPGWRSYCLLKRYLYLQNKTLLFTSGQKAAINSILLTENINDLRKARYQD
jgi:hypothetical protein